MYEKDINLLEVVVMKKISLLLASVLAAVTVSGCDVFTSFFGGDSSQPSGEGTKDDSNKNNGNSEPWIQDDDDDETVESYTVTLYANNGSGESIEVTISSSSYSVPSCSFNYTDHSFNGWALGSPDGVTYFTGNTISNISGDIVLYATWVEESSGGDPTDYYSSISNSLSGDSLLTALRNLNLSKRHSEAGYSNMGTSTNSDPKKSPFMYTDYDPTTVQYDAKGQPYGTKILSFYSGNSVTGWNKEHVWPASRLTGGRDNNIVDDDIYMPRPTITSENSVRGNSIFYEGKSTQYDGWDPITQFGADNVYTGIRGECARIIFYAMTVDSTLVLNENVSNEGNNMGRLTDLLKWNLADAVNDREERRQSGGQYLQGNRNAFVDHPDYACKIWGTTSNQTKQICGLN